MCLAHSPDTSHRHLVCQMGYESAADRGVQSGQQHRPVAKRNISSICTGAVRSPNAIHRGISRCASRELRVRRSEDDAIDDADEHNDEVDEHDCDSTDSGGRCDLAMLYFSPQIWFSDNTDAIVRMRIQFGSSLLFPARCIGAHISAVPNHITGNWTRARTRGLVAMCGTFGYEMDVAAQPQRDKALFRQLSKCFRDIAPIIHRGDCYRLWSPFKVLIHSC